MTDSKTAHLKYIPAPRKPDGFDARWLSIVGLSPNNVDPYVRFVWGMDRMEKFGDEQVPRYPDPDGKYVGLECWVLEGWQSPEVYDRIEWERHEKTLGEFPVNGVWDFIEAYRTPDFRMIPLGEGAFKKAYEWKIWKSKPKQRAVADLLEYRNRVAELKEARWEERKQEIYAEFIETYDKEATTAPKAPEFSKNLLSGYKTTDSGLIVPNR